LACSSRPLGLTSEPIQTSKFKIQNSKLSQITMRRNRRNQPSLLRTAARASVISSAMTASSQATSNAMHNRAARQSATDPQPQPIEMVPPPAAVEPPPAAPPTDLVAQLAQLAQLKEAGALTDDEFQTAKAKLLGTGDAAE
jgi:hypothetical protein